MGFKIIDPHNDQFPVGPIAQLVEHCTSVTEVRPYVWFSFVMGTLGMRGENIFDKSFSFFFRRRGYFILPGILADWDWDSLLLQLIVYFLCLIFPVLMTSPNTFINCKSSIYHCSFSAFSFSLAPVIACGGEDNRLHIFTEKDNNLKVKRKQQYLAIIPRAHVGHEMIDSQRDA